MIAARKEIQLGSAGEFSAGLASWIAGERDADAEAASMIVAETVMMHRAWLDSKFEKGGD